MAEPARSRAPGQGDGRARLIGAVRAACNRLGIQEADRRAIQLQVTGKESLAQMSNPEIGRVLDKLNAGRGPSMGHRPHIGKIKALWWSLYWIGAVRDPGEAVLAAFVERQTGRQRLEWLDSKEAFRVIEALKAWAAREGIRWPDPEADADGRGDRHAVLAAIGDELVRRGVIRGICHIPYLQRAQGLGCNHLEWTARELDEAIRFLGKKLRRQLEQEAMQ